MSRDIVERLRAERTEPTWQKNVVKILGPTPLELEAAAEIERLRAEGASWECGARKQGTAGGNDPADCNWPTCGCDPYATKVIETLQESGKL